MPLNPKPKTLLKVAVLGLEVLCNFGAKIVLELLHLLVPVAEVHLAVECVQSAEGRWEEGHDESGGGRGKNNQDAKNFVRNIVFNISTTGMKLVRWSGEEKCMHTRIQACRKCYADWAEGKKRATLEPEEEGNGARGPER